MRAWRRFSLQGFRLRFVAVLFIGALCVGVALVAGHEGSSAPTAHILAGRDTRSQMAHARFARLTRARIGVSRGATTRRVETFLRTTQAVASTAATGSTPSEIGHRAGPRVPSERPLRVQRIGRSNRETLAVLRATKKARTRQHATTQKVSKSARRRSRSEYRRLTGREALALGRRTFRLALSTPAFNAATPAPGVRRVRGVSAHAEVVSRQTAGGSTLNSHARASASTAGAAASGGQLLVSTSPLSTSNGQPVNLAVTGVSGGFQAKNPLVPVTIAGTLQGGVTFPHADFGFALQASGSDKPIQTPSGVFFANVGGAANATDFQVNADPTGAESFLQIRSASSRQSYVMHFQLPAGAHLETAQTDDPIAHDPPTAIEIVQGDTPLGYMYEPNAVDATGAPIPAHATIDGSNVVLSVSDQGAGVQYPVLLDPLVTVQNSYACNDSWTPNWYGWSFAEWDTYENPSEQWWFGQAVDNCAYYPGLYVSMPTYNPFQAGNYGAYEITAPAGAYIDDAMWGTTDHIPLASALLMGLYEPAQGAFETGVGTYDGSSWASGNPADYQQELVGQLVGVCTNQCTTPAVGGNEAMFGIQATVNVYTDLQRAIVGSENALVMLGDVNPPTVTGLPASTNGWTNQNTYSGSVTAQDVGLGLGSVTYPGGTNGASTTTTISPGCGDPYNGNACPPAASEPYSFTLPDGVTNLTASATDIVGNPSTPDTSILKIDTTPPAMTLSGSAYEPGVPITTDTSLSLNASATDSSSTIETSGVVQISTQIDGQPSTMGPNASDTCPKGNCPLSASGTINTANLTNGAHDITVVATDGAGNATSYGWSIDVDIPTAAAQSGQLQADCTPSTPTNGSNPVAGLIDTAAQAVTTLLNAVPGLGTASQSITGISGDTLAPAFSSAQASDAVSSGDPQLATANMAEPAQIDLTTGAFELGSGATAFCVSPVSATPAMTVGDVVNNLLGIFANVASGVDTVLRPTVVGMQSLLQFRSSSSPQSYSWTVQLQPGQQLEQLTNGEVALVDPPPPSDVQLPIPPTTTTSSAACSASTPLTANSESNTTAQLCAANYVISQAASLTNGQAIAVFTAPWAQDAAGNAITTSLSTSGDTITLNVPFTSSNTFPVVADEQMQDVGAGEMALNPDPMSMTLGGGEDYTLAASDTSPASATDYGYVTTMDDDTGQVLQDRAVTPNEVDPTMAATDDQADAASAQGLCDAYSYHAKDFHFLGVHRHVDDGLGDGSIKSEQFSSDLAEFYVQDNETSIQGLGEMKAYTMCTGGAAHATGDYQLDKYVTAVSMNTDSYNPEDGQQVNQFWGTTKNITDGTLTVGLTQGPFTIGYSMPVTSSGTHYGNEGPWDYKPNTPLVPYTYNEVNGEFNDTAAPTNREDGNTAAGVYLFSETDPTKNIHPHDEYFVLLNKQCSGLFNTGIFC